MPVSSSRKNDEPGNGGPRDSWSNWVRMYAVALEFLVYLGVCGYAGWVLDERRGWTPWGLLGGFAVGITLGLVRMIREAKRLGL